MTPDAPIDMAVLEKIKEIGENELVIKIIDLFIDYIATKVAEAKNAMMRGDLTGVQDAVHPIKSGASNVGAHKLRAIALFIEQLAMQKKGDQIPPRLLELEAAYLQAKAALEELRKTISA